MTEVSRICLPRPQPRPVRRMALTLALATTVLAALVVGADPARADMRPGQPQTVAARGLPVQPQAVPATPLVDVRSPRVPGVCAVEIAGRRGSLTVYPERCLRREGFDSRLPRHCAQPIRLFGRNDRAYEERCLRDAGFRAGGRDIRPHDPRHPGWGHDRRGPQEWGPQGWGRPQGPRG